MPEIHLQNSLGVLVTDFDGTITQYDFYRLAIEQLIPRNCPNYWSLYRSGNLTHFEALNAYFQSIQATEKQVFEILDQMIIDPQIAQATKRLRNIGWEVVVTSAGCSWYIDHLLTQANVKLEVHANPGEFTSQNGLKMRLPYDSRFFSPTVGIDKAGVVQHYINTGAIVAFAGDGLPDVDAAKLVPDKLRFARGDLANELQSVNIPFIKFDVWSEVAGTIFERFATP